MDRNSHIMLTKKVHNAINYNYTILVLILLFDEYNLCYDNKFTRFLFKFFKSNNIEPLALKKKKLQMHAIHFQLTPLVLLSIK